MSNGEVKVSVVIPVYNTEKYLPECLDSILGQTLREIEVICVDDGSSDGSWDILQTYANKDERMKLIQQENQYAGVARNNGMAQATGKYIMFYDSDDFMALDALELMYDQCEKDDADICVCAGERFYEQLGFTVETPTYLNTKRLPTEMPFNRRINAQHIFTFTTVMMWNKMIRLEFLRKHGLKFGTTRNGEDSYICMMSLWDAERITVVKKPLTFYRIDRADSLVGTLCESAVDVLRSLMAVYSSLGSNLGEAKQSFDNKVLGVTLHTFRNVSSAQAFEGCFSYAKNTMLDEMNLEVRLDGYYYSSWYNDLVRHLRIDSLEDFKSFILYSTCRSLETANARKLDFKKKLKESKRKNRELVKQLRSFEKKLADIQRKFSKVEWLYKAASTTLRIPRKIKRNLRNNR